MRRFIVCALAVVGAIALVFTALLGTAVYYGVKQASKMSAPVSTGPAILSLDLDGKLPEKPGSNPLDAVLNAHDLSLRDVVTAIDRAAGDSNIRGLMAKVGQSEAGLAQVQEIRDAVARFRKSGKPTLAFADTFGEGAGGTAPYYLAASFEQVWMQPSGDLGLTGVGLERPFFKDALALLGVEPRFGQRYEFKGGIDSFIQTSMPEPLRASLTALVDDLLGQVVEGVSRDRGLDADTVRDAISRAPLFADEALDAKLLTKLGYLDEAREEIIKSANTRRFLDVEDYPIPSDDDGKSDARRIAVVYGVGPVMRGGSEEGGFGSSETLSSDRVAAALDAASRDSTVGAIILRLDSPGGSYVASDTVWRAVHRARERGKPVIASMSSMAASGGYFIAIAADQIVAEPATLTGSIGVYGGKFVLTGLWDKLGLSWDRVTAGAHAGLYSPNRDFTAEEWSRFDTSLDRIYADFTARVGKDRKLDADALDKVARGRVWTGQQALKVGLVDGLGGFDEALRRAKEIGKFPADGAVPLTVYPRPEKPFERAFRLMSKLDRTESHLNVLARIETMLAPLLEQARLSSGDNRLSMPPMRETR